MIHSGRADIDPHEAASKAMEAYDENSDDFLDAKELEASPALSVALPRIDADHDERLSANEIAARLESYEQLSNHIGLELRVTKSGRPLADAELALAPAPFLGEALPTYQGKTDRSGVAQLTTSPPTPGVAVGLYRASITLPDGSTEERGFEVADDVPSATRPRIAL